MQSYILNSNNTFICFQLCLIVLSKIFTLTILDDGLEKDQKQFYKRFCFCFSGSPSVVRRE